MHLKNITVLIRSAGERTVNICYDLLSDLFSEEKINIIEEVPFAAAVKKGLEIGIEQGRKWTMTIDADVLIDNQGVLNLFEKAESVPEYFFVVQGLILDKFFPVYRPSGIHFYRTSLMNKAQGLISKNELSVRPESDLLDDMARQGYPWMQCESVVGIHDYEQYYRDIFRKCFIQAHKHHWLIEKAEKYWRQKQEEDQDFKVALWGSSMGKLHTDNVYIDKNFVKEQFSEIAELKGLTEKLVLQVETGKIVNESFHNYSTDEFEYFQSAMFSKARWNQIYDKKSINNNYNQASKANIVRKVCHKMGRYMVKAGEKMQY